jgi:hypothetical protein
MPKGPKGQKRPADVIAIKVARIATGEAPDCPESRQSVVEAMDHSRPGK